MGGARDQTKNKAMKDAVKALAAAAKSLASAAEALDLLCEDDEDTIAGSGLSSSKYKSNGLPQNGSPSIVYEDSDDEWMEKAREQVRVEAASWDWKHDSVNGPQTDQAQPPPNLYGSSPTLSATRPRLAGGIGAGRTNDTESLTTNHPGGARLAPKDSKPSYMKGTTTGLSSHRIVSPVPTTTSVEKPAFTPPSRTWANIASEWATGPSAGPSETLTPSNTNGDEWEAASIGAEAPGAPFQNLVKRWPRPTFLQKEILDSLRMDCDTLVCYGHTKSAAHAILVHCMEELRALPQSVPPEGVILALIIVPQQTTGRLWLNFANELFRDFELPHKALLLPGGGSDVITEAERMQTERIDILISTPRVFINHVHNNPALRVHLARLRFMIFPEAYELTKKDEFLNFQFNVIKKRLQTRAKVPRQIIIAAPTLSGQIETFKTRAFAPNSAEIVSSSTSDDPLDCDWPELVQI